MPKVRTSGGYTLMELLLVLAIIVVAAAAVAPSLRNIARNATLRSAASDVRAALTRAHVLAMKTGRIHVFQYEPNGAKYKIEPWIADDDALESKDGGSDLGAAPPAASAARELILPDGITFALGDAASTSRGQHVEEELTSMGGIGATWSRPILFYPDGTAADAFVVVANDRDVGIRVNLRGITSAVTVSELSGLTSLEQEQALAQ
jgi:prepilin-type N-terminal cleavage/methylation domain-containing protein